MTLAGPADLTNHVEWDSDAARFSATLLDSAGRCSPLRRVRRQRHLLRREIRDLGTNSFRSTSEKDEPEIGDQQQVNHQVDVEHGTTEGEHGKQAQEGQRAEPHDDVLATLRRR